MADKTIDELCAALVAKREKAALGGGEKAIAKQHDKGKMTARERIDAFRSRSRRYGARIANGHICRFLRTQHNCTLSLLRTNPLHARPVTCS